MTDQSRKWMILIATTWIQAFTGTNFDFSSYSSSLKSVLGISQLQLNCLSVASDMGKAFGWCSGYSLRHLPLWAVLFLTALMGLFGYGLQWLVIENAIKVPYSLVFLLCLLAGCSICWFNTICYVLCITSFPSNRSLALSLSISFNGISAALYTLLANAISPTSHSLYLLLNAAAPLVVSLLTLLPILQQPSLHLLPDDSISQEPFIFLGLNILAVGTGLYVLLSDSLFSDPSNAAHARFLLCGALLLLAIPLLFLGIVWTKDWIKHTIFKSVDLQKSTVVEIRQHLLANDANGRVQSHRARWFRAVVDKGRLHALGEEHSVRLLVRRCDFWLYYAAYFCGGTVGIVYSNNLGQIAQSLGFYSNLSSFVTLYSSCSFFGRLLSAAPDFLHMKTMRFARTGWLAASLTPTPIAYFLLVASGSEVALKASTAIIGLSSGFIFSASVSITSELFGPNSAGVNHNILITNIPIGSLFLGLIAAVLYDSNAGGSSYLETMEVGEEIMCMGRHCYWVTFVCWGCVSLIGVVSGILLFLRTKDAYDSYERNRTQRSLI